MIQIVNPSWSKSPGNLSCELLPSIQKEHLSCNSALQLDVIISEYQKAYPAVSERLTQT